MSRGHPREDGLHWALHMRRKTDKNSKRHLCCEDFEEPQIKCGEGQGTGAGVLGRCGKFHMSKASSSVLMRRSKGATGELRAGLPCRSPQKSPSAGVWEYGGREGPPLSAPIRGAPCTDTVCADLPPGTLGFGCSRERPPGKPRGLSP